MDTGRDSRPLILHVVYRFDTGGLENGIVNLINQMDPAAYRHAVLALTEITDFRRRVTGPDVEFFALGKPPGHAFKCYPDVWRLLRRLRPAVVHTRNLAAMELMPAVWAAGVPARVHSEHGREGHDLHGLLRRYQWMRRIYGLFVHRFVALSAELHGYLTERVSLPAQHVLQICNGVDARLFSPAESRQVIAGCPFADPSVLVVGTVGRMQPVKDQATLAKAFVMALKLRPDLRRRLRLVMVGNGPLLPMLRDILVLGQVADCAWLPGERTDIPDLLRGLDLFVLPSLSEGISNTVLEAMATGLPVLATRVGGNLELVQDEASGLLVRVGDVDAMAAALIRLADDDVGRQAMGRLGRQTVEQRFSLEAMVRRYQALYDEVTGRSQPMSVALKGN